MQIISSLLLRMLCRLRSLFNMPRALTARCNRRSEGDADKHCSKVWVHSRERQFVCLKACLQCLEPELHTKRSIQEVCCFGSRCTFGQTELENFDTPFACPRHHPLEETF